MGSERKRERERKKGTAEMDFYQIKIDTKRACLQLRENLSFIAFQSV
jgi:hypothetical protein